MSTLLSVMSSPDIVIVVVLASSFWATAALRATEAFDSLTVRRAPGTIRSQNCVVNAVCNLIGF